MAITAIGASCVAFTAGVIGGNQAGASWRWSSVVVITQMAMFGSFFGLSITIAKHSPVDWLRDKRVWALVSGAFGFLFGGCSTYFADRFVGKNFTKGYPHSCICAYSLLALRIYSDIVQGKGLF